MKRIDISIGCSSWLDKDLINEGGFYPAKSMTSEERLRWYARFFNFVEVNSSFYGIPAPDVAQSWVDRTPDDFKFAIKAWGPMTGHATVPLATPPEIRRYLLNVRRNAEGNIDAKDLPPIAFDASFDVFRRMLDPLAKSGKLHYALFQMAPWFGMTEDSVAYLESLPKRLEGIDIAVEFRNPSWVPSRTEKVFDILRHNGLRFVDVDCPWSPRLKKTTGNLYILRCHGRNVPGWEAQMRGKRPTVAEKYDYLYDEAELRELIVEGDEPFDIKAGPLGQVYSFNNNRRDYPVKNALQAKRLAGQRTLDVAKEKEAWLARKRSEKSK